MEKRDNASTLVVPLDQCSFSLIDLPNDYNKSLSKLVDHVKSIIAANEKHHGRRCEKFYIGKSTLHTWSGRHFDSHNRYTWKTELIRQRWDARRQHGYQAMAVLTVVTNDTLPPLKSRRPAQWKQQYTLALEQALITHFMFVEDDERLENETTVPGNLERSGAVAYVLYLAMKFENARDPGLNPARECKEDDTLDLSSWVLVPASAPTQSSSKQGSTHVPQKSFPCSPNTASTTDTTGVTVPQKSLPSSPNTASTTNTTAVTVPGYKSPPSSQYGFKVVTNHLQPSNLPTNTPKSSHFCTTDQDVTRNETPPLKNTIMHTMSSACRSLFKNMTSHSTNPTFQNPTPFVPRDLTPTFQKMHPGSHSTTFQAMHPATPSRDTGIKPCKCGSTTHRITSHHECPLRRPTCRCGSATHQRINHRDCPLNPKRTT